MKNNNSSSIRKLSKRSLKNNRMRNLFAVIAIALTGMLFTAVFSMVSGIMQITQEQTSHEVGMRAHAGLKESTWSQYEKIIQDPLVKRSSYNIFISIADNILKRQAEIRYTPEEEWLEDIYITLEEGHIPTAKNEIIVDTFTMDELKIPHALGEKVPLSFTFMGETIEEEFVVSGWYQGDYISHASELFLSEAYWNELKGSLTEDDFKKWREEHFTEEGDMQVNLFFYDDKSIEEKVQTVIRNAGYEPDTEVAYGVNWAYMSSRMDTADPMTLSLLAVAVVVILLTGYLIIYNIFRISVMADIRFYGLLKTIGTTGKQIRRLIGRQAFFLSAVGIPVGLAVGYGLGKAALPFILNFTDFDIMSISLKFNPWILIFSAGFSILTVFFSCRKPGKIAGRVSPIEAVKYTEVYGTRKKKKKRRGRFNIVSMAFANLGRNKQKSAIVIAAISLSMILLTLVMTAVSSFRLDNFLEQRIAGDFMLGSINFTRTSPISYDFTIDKDFLALADMQEGIEERSELWYRPGSYIQVDEKAQEQFRKLDEEGKLRRESYFIDDLEKMMNGERSIDSAFYGYNDELLKNLKIIEGTLDIEKFNEGGYILLGAFLGGGEITLKDHIYHPGDKIVVENVTKDTIIHDITDDTGMLMDVWYENLSCREYEVMAIVDIPYSMNIHTSTVNGCDAILPLQGFADDTISCQCFAVSYSVSEEFQSSFEEMLKNYSENVNPLMGYVSKGTLHEEFNNMITVVATIGIALSAVIALIGILNFINAMITEIISRKRELAMLQSIGMTKTQIRKLLICEGIGYIGIAGVVSFFAGSLLAWKVLSALNNIIMFFEYHFLILPFLIMIPLLLLVATLAPLIAYNRMQRKSVVERLRETET